MSEPRAISTQQAIDFVNREARVRVHSAAIGDKSVMAEGVVVAFIPSPCIVLQHEDGSQGTWGITLPIAEIPDHLVRMSALINQTVADLKAMDALPWYDALRLGHQLLQADAHRRRTEGTAT